MEAAPDYSKAAILYVDDEEKSLKYFARAFSSQFRILTANNATDAYRLLEQHAADIGVLMTDQQMPGERGVQLLEKARQLRPEIIRILATAYSDLDAVIGAVNSGAIYRYVTKPWDPQQLELTLKHALQFYTVQRERDQLLQEKLSVLRDRMVADRILSLGLLSAGLSHHIRNALVAVKTFVDLMPLKLKAASIDPAQLPDAGFWQTHYASVRAELGKINRLLSDLWEASEKPALHFGDRVHVQEALDAALAKLGPELAAKPVHVRQQIPSDLPLLAVDRPKFCRLFELLLHDQAIHLPRGSTITLTAEPVPAAGSPAAPPEIRVLMRDDGPGLPPELLRVVFDPFVVRSDLPGEFGINLMACFFIAHYHGGRIEAQSDPGKGSTFCLTFRTDPNQPPAATEPTNIVEQAIGTGSLFARLQRQSG